SPDGAAFVAGVFGSAFCSPPQAARPAIIPVTAVIAKALPKFIFDLLFAAPTRDPLLRRNFARNPIRSAASLRGTTASRAPRSRRPQPRRLDHTRGAYRGIRHTINFFGRLGPDVRECSFAQGAAQPPPHGVGDSMLGAGS